MKYTAIFSIMALVMAFTQHVCAISMAAIVFTGIMSTRELLIMARDTKE